MRFVSRLCALGATLGAALTMIGPGSAIGAADPAASPANPLLAQIAAQIGLPAQVWTASGTHTARGYTSAAAQTTSVEGMRADCDNINLNKKLSTDFLSGVFGPGLIGFFYYQLVYDQQHDTYWIDEPFTCTARTSP